MQEFITSFPAIWIPLLEHRKISKLDIAYMLCLLILTYTLSYLISNESGE